MNTKTNIIFSKKAISCSLNTAIILIGSGEIESSKKLECNLSIARDGLRLINIICEFDKIELAKFVAEQKIATSETFRQLFNLSSEAIKLLENHSGESYHGISNKGLEGMYIVCRSEAEHSGSEDSIEYYTIMKIPKDQLQNITHINVVADPFGFKCELFKLDTLLTTISVPIPQEFKEKNGSQFHSIATNQFEQNMTSRVTDLKNEIILCCMELVKIEKDNALQHNTPFDERGELNKLVQEVLQNFNR